MPQASAAAVRNTPSGRKTPGNNVPSAQKPPSRPEILPRPRDKIIRHHDIEDTHALKDYQLGDSLGKGAHGAVYRALNWGTGETVAIKRIKLADLPQNELQSIMMEIDLMKNLNHPNIVKYHGFVKTSLSLYITMEYCENGSLHSICKNFGKFPESLVGLYMSQVLNGLLYLHEQGVIHRDIKGANILTTKEGTVKVADFGVARKDDPGIGEATGAVGTPHWMAPEVIQLLGHTTAADIWSLGCTVIELLDGKPPYHKMEAPAALFRMVSDDHPPFPEAISSTVNDFLNQCFQKDPNLRVSAKKLLKHPWIVNAKRAVQAEPVKPTVYDEAVRNIKQWNEALRSPQGSVTAHSPRQRHDTAIAPLPSEIPLINNDRTDNGAGIVGGPPAAQTRPSIEQYKAPELNGNADECWDDDFASSIGSQILKLPQLHPVDNFDGKLSSEKLRAYAAEDSPMPTNNGSPMRRIKNRSGSSNYHDPLETVRPSSPAKHALKKQQAPLRTPTKISQRVGPLSKSQQTIRPVEKQPSPSRPPRAVGARTHGLKRTSSMFRENADEDYNDLLGGDGDEDVLQQKLEQLRIKQQASASKPSFTHVDDLKSSPQSASDSRSDGKSPGGSDQSLSLLRARSSVEIMKFADKLEDEDDFSDVFGNDGSAFVRKKEEPKSSMLTKVSNQSWPGDEDEQDDPFAQLEEDLDEMDMKSKVAKDREVRTGAFVESLVDSLKTDQPDDILADVSEQLKDVLAGYPEMRQTIIRSHGLLPILEVLENCPHRDITLSLLKVINIIILDSHEIQENLCFIGGIPIITRFAHKKYPSDIRVEAAAFVRQMYQTSAMTHQMFISCGGLNVLVEFLEEDYDEERDLVLIGVNGIWNVFAFQASTLRTDFCRILSRTAILYPLSLILDRVLDENGELAELVQGRIVSIFLIFSQAEYHVKESIADRMVLKRVLKDLSRMSQPHRITMLKFIKNLSMLATTLDALHGANAIETLIGLLENSKGQEFEDMSNHVINIMFNLCRLNKMRQEDAALNGLVPILQRLIKTQRPVKEFALPILCDIAHSGKIGRKCLWQHKALPFYIQLLAEPYWQVTALDAIFVWLQEETAKVEEHVLNSTFSDAVEHCFASSKGDSFENLLEPLQKLLRLSPPVAASLVRPRLFDLTKERLSNKKPVVRGNLLRIIRSIVDSSEDGSTQLRHHKLHGSIRNLADNDNAILVRNMAADIIASLEASLPQGGLGMGIGVARSSASIDGLNRYRGSRRTSGAAMLTPPALHASSSQPPTPQTHSRPGGQGDDYFDMPTLYAATGRTRQSVAGVGGTSGSSMASRPGSRDGPKPSLYTGINAHIGHLGAASSPAASAAAADAGGPAGMTLAAKRRLSRPSVSRPPPSSKGSKSALSPKKEEGGGASGFISGRETDSRAAASRTRSSTASSASGRVSRAARGSESRAGGGVGTVHE